MRVLQIDSSVKNKIGIAEVDTVVGTLYSVGHGGVFQTVFNAEPVDKHVGGLVHDFGASPSIVGRETILDVVGDGYISHIYTPAVSVSKTCNVYVTIDGIEHLIQPLRGDKEKQGLIGFNAPVMSNFDGAVLVNNIASAAAINQALKFSFSLKIEFECDDTVFSISDAKSKFGIFYMIGNEFEYVPYLAPNRVVEL